MNWKKYWSEFPRQFSETDFKRQVQYTVGGKPVCQGTISDIENGVIENLSIRRGDRVLDLCCGNGMFTRQIADLCERVVGVDYSDTLIKIAGTHNKKSNIQYINEDAIAFTGRCAEDGQRFDKILVCGAFQYFDRRLGRALIQNMALALEEDGKILLCGVPDAHRKSNFYNTPAKRLRHIWRMLTRRERLGVWWTKKAIQSICAETDLACQFHESRGQIGSHYRFDVLLTGRPLENAPRSSRRDTV